ncbi:MAG: hypothetical protein AAGE52_08950 [Myxococcota bacterium]
MRTCAAFIILALACTGGSDPEIQDNREFLSPTEHLVRASMALRGIRPSLDELDAVAEDPGYLPAIVDYYLTTDEFGVTIRELHGESLLLGVAPDIYPAGFPTVGDLADRTSHEINLSVIEAPLRLIEYVVMNDRPYHEIVTGEFTLADDIVATVWGLPYDEAEGGWQVTTYDDGRPVAGILSDGFVFTRHASTFSNKNRGRAAQIARGLLCYDFLDRQVEIDSGIDLADEEAVAFAIRENATCVSCHQTLDPLASFFADHFPIRVPGEAEDYPLEQYAPEFAPLYRTARDRGYFGQSGVDLHDLGVRMAQDSRFTMCAARRFYAHFAQEEERDIPLDLVSRFRDEFVASDMNARALARAIVLSDEFRVRRIAEDAAEDAADDADVLVGLKRATPQQLERTIADLTGFTWRTSFLFDFGTGTIGEVDLMSDPFFGYRVLGGGTDSVSVTRPTRTASATTSLVHRELAGRAAQFVVQRDLNEPDPMFRRLLREVDATTTDEAQIRAQLVQVHRRFFGETPLADDPSVTAAWNVFDGTLRASGDPERAWTTTLFAMLQDIRITYY